MTVPEIADIQCPACQKRTVLLTEDSWLNEDRWSCWSCGHRWSTARTAPPTYVSSSGDATKGGYPR